MAKRRTKPNASSADTAPLAPMRTVARYVSPLEAHMVRGLLEAEGVPCVLGNELFSAVDSPVAVATGGVSVQVRETDFARAAGILNAQAQESSGQAGRPGGRRAGPFAWMAGLLLLWLLLGFAFSLWENLAQLRR